MRVALVVLASLVACTASSEPTSTSTLASAIVMGTESDASQNATVLVMHYDALQKGGGAASGCTGSLLAPRLVLTARHCVSSTDLGAACNAKGEATAGGAVLADDTPSALYVFGGTGRPDFLAGTTTPARGTAILTTGVSNLCNSDLALIVLDREVAGARTTPVRLAGGPVAGEALTLVGWGIADDVRDPATRRMRTGVTVLAVGPAEGLGPAEFGVGEGACEGDSGGPAISAAGAVVGALSRGGNGTGNSGADGCLGGVNVYSSLAAHADFLRSGYAKVGAEPWLEGMPNPALAAQSSRDDDEGGCQATGRRPTPPSAAFFGCVVAVFFLGRARKSWVSSRGSGDQPGDPRNG